MNHYQILDINSSCSQSEIKKAYRSQVKKYHPDINPDPTSTDRIIKINEAYEILSEVTTRNLYDQYMNGVPIKTVIRETTPEQRYRAEYVQNRVRRKREQMEYQIRIKQKFYRYYRFVNMLFFGIGFLLTIDYYYMPDQRVEQLKFIGLGQYNSNIIMENGDRYSLAQSFYYDYFAGKGKGIIVLHSSILRKPAKIRVNGEFEDYTIQRTLYSFKNVFSILILVFSAVVLKHKRYSDFRLSCGLIAFIPALYILLFIGLKIL